ncbi:MAG: hypothetical protein N2110_00510 [Flavobacteriales bacterium]|nr:hypothetical protein [Flavobacteriales bacterium]
MSEELKYKGLKEGVSDGLTEMEAVVSLHFPKARFHKCVVQMELKVLKRLRPKDKGGYIDGLSSGI